MKTIIRVLVLFTVVLFSSCSDEGDVNNNYDLLGTVFETTGSFSASNAYKLYFQFPNDVVVYDGDVVMVYILWGQTDTNEDIWRPLPQSVFLIDGSFQYNFDYTLNDVQIYLEANFDKGTLEPGDLENQTFRIAVIPAELYQNKSVDIQDFNSVMQISRLSGKSLQLKTLN